jgi:hypothetical protein
MAQDYLAGLFSRGNRIRREVKDFASNPADYIRQAASLIAEVGQDVTRTPQESLELSKKQLSKPMSDEQLNEMIGNMIPGGGVVGSIRRGGRSDLIMTHETPINSVLRRIKQNLNISNPSYAINNTRVDPFMPGDPYSATVLMNPRATHYIDPAKNPTNELVNRDQYTHREKGPVTPQEFRMGNASPRLTEGLHFSKPEYYSKQPVPGVDFGSIGSNSVDHTLQILGSPKFDLASYERSRYGAQTLDPTKALSRRGLQNELEDNYSATMDHLRSLPTREQGETARKLIQDAAKSEAPEAKKFLDIIGSGFSSYAEMKSHTSLPLTPKTVSAVMLPPKASYQAQAEADALRQAGRINIGTPKQVLEYAGIDPRSITHSQEMKDLTKYLTESASAGKELPVHIGYPGIGDIDLTSYQARKAYGQAMGHGDTKALEDFLAEQYLDTKDFSIRAAQAITTKDAGDSISHLLNPTIPSP